MYQYSFSKNSVHSSEPLELIYSDLFELSILVYPKYKWVITFLDNYSFYYNIAFCQARFTLGLEVCKMDLWNGLGFSREKSEIEVSTNLVCCC